MARQLRIEYEDAFYHITSRGNERRKIYFTKTDYEKFLEYIAKAKEKYTIKIHGYVLMTNHYHLIIETPEANLKKTMHYINSSYTAYTNTKHKRSGHLFQGRYKGILIDKDNYLTELSRYIHLNPVRAKITEKPEDYPYSSYLSYITDKKDPVAEQGLILAMLSDNIKEARRKYREYVENAIGAEQESPFVNVYGGIILGRQSFIKDTLKKIKSERLNEKEISRKKSLSVVYDSEDIIDAIARHYKTTKIDLLQNKSSEARKITVYFLKRETGLTNRQIGEMLGGISYSAAAKMHERFSKEIEKNRKLGKIVDRIKKELSNV